MVLWIGQSISPQILSDVLGVEDVSAVDRNLVCHTISWCNMYSLNVPVRTPSPVIEIINADT